MSLDAIQLTPLEHELLYRAFLLTVEKRRSFKVAGLARTERGEFLGHAVYGLGQVLTAAEDADPELRRRAEGRAS